MQTTRIARQMHSAAQKAGPAAIEAALDAYIARTTRIPSTHVVVRINTAKLRPL